MNSSAILRHFATILQRCGNRLGQFAPRSRSIGTVLVPYQRSFVVKKTMMITLGAALVAVPVLAAPAFGKADQDGDGITTRAEVETGTAQMFAKMDANGDGKLDATDRSAHRKEMRAKAFERMDANKDGNISKAEWDQHGAERAEKRGAHASKRGEAGEDRKGRHHATRMMRGRHHGMMRKADTNGDNAISLAEFQTAALARFDRADANKDGQLTAEEREAQRNMMRAQHRAGKRAPTDQ
jgi:hypothetical protein